MPLSAYQIVATLGPASQDPETWTQMAAAGASGFRLNTSHLTLENLERWLGRYQAFLRTAEYCLPLVLDLQGSKWRLGSFSPFELVPGEMVRLVQASQTAHPGELPVPHPDFFAAAAVSSGEVNLNDAKVRLEITAMQDGLAYARTTLGGPVQANKGITLPASPYRVEQLNAKDLAILERTRGLEWVRYAISYLRDGEEMARYRALFGASAHLIAKLERQPALDDARAVALHASELWLCRGDLGAELGLPAMAAEAHRFSSRVE